MQLGSEQGVVVSGLVKFTSLSRHSRKSDKQIPQIAKCAQHIQNLQVMRSLYCGHMKQLLFGRKAVFKEAQKPQSKNRTWPALTI